MNKVIVAVDPDEDCIDIVEFTGNFLQSDTSEVVVFHSYEGYSTAITDAEKTDKVAAHWEEIEKAVDAIVHQLSERGVKAVGKLGAKVAIPSKEIIRFAEGEKANLIVMGTHRQGRLERFVLGSIAEEVIRNSPMAVVVVPRKS